SNNHFYFVSSSYDLKFQVAPNGFVVTDRSHSTTASANFHLFEITSDGRRKPASSPLRRFQSAHFDKDHVFFKPAPKTKLLMQNEPIAPNSDLDRTDLSPNSNSKPGNTEQNWSY
uniref:DPPIV_N domain-containing protein n=1 Tax=Bursaphelenchus xylophilus TaxID=6326 RepID=A0A1I7SKR9_BURXY